MIMTIFLLISKDFSMRRLLTDPRGREEGTAEPVAHELQLRSEAQA